MGGASHSISHVTHSVQKSLLLVPPTCGSSPAHWSFTPISVVQTGSSDTAFPPPTSCLSRNDQIIEKLLKQSDRRQQVVGGAPKGGGARKQVHFKVRMSVLAVVKLSCLRGLIDREQHTTTCGRVVLWVEPHPLKKAAVSRVSSRAQRGAPAPHFLPSHCFPLLVSPGFTTGDLRAPPTTEGPASSDGPIRGH